MAVGEDLRSKEGNEMDMEEEDWFLFSVTTGNK